MDIFDSVIIDILLVASLIVILLYLYLDRKYSYWARKGVPHIRPTSFIFGNAKELFLERECSAIIYDNIYRQFEGKPYCGFYEFQYPVLLLRDPDLIQVVMVEKFNSFHNNMFTESVNPKADPFFCQNPFILKGSRWKEARTLVSSGLTLNKLRALEEIFKPIHKNVSKYFNENDSTDIPVLDMCKHYTSEMVSNYGWGIQNDGFSKDSMINRMFEAVTFVENKALVLQLLHPFLSYWLKMKFITKEFEEFLKSVTSQAIGYLENSKTSQISYLQNLLNAREKMRQNGKDMSLQEMTAHMSTFYLDAYDTVARVLSVIVYSIALNPDVQQRLREEVNSVKDEITIESVNKMQYMEMVISEASRLYSPLSHFARICTEKCKLGAVEVEPGTKIVMPLYSTHRDPKYFPDPEKFNPENFSEENKSKRHKFVFSLFGFGPRQCPGMKYAVANLKLFLFYILKEYEILPPENHPANPIEHNPYSILFYLPKDPLYARFKKLKT